MTDTRLERAFDVAHDLRREHCPHAGSPAKVGAMAPLPGLSVGPRRSSCLRCLAEALCAFAERERERGT